MHCKKEMMRTEFWVEKFNEETERIVQDPMDDNYVVLVTEVDGLQRLGDDGFRLRFRNPVKCSSNSFLLLEPIAKENFNKIAAHVVWLTMAQGNGFIPVSKGRKYYIVTP